MVTHLSLVQRAITAGQIGATDNEQIAKDEPRRESLLPLKVYLNLELLIDEISDNHLLSSKHTIKQGKSYGIVVYSSDSLNPDVKQVELTITSDIELLLECTVDGDTPSKIIIENPWRIMTYQQVALREDALSDDEGYESFFVTVPNDCPKGCVSFRLSYRRVNNKIKLSPRFATSTQATVDGPYDFNDKVLRKQCYIDADTSLPESTAILYVTEVNSSKLQMTCGYSGKILQVSSTDWIPTRLADFAERAKSSFAERASWTKDPTKEIVEEIRKTLRNFSSQGPPELLRWMYQLLKNCEEPMRFIIFDDTNFEIPWEMLEFDDEDYFGAHAAIVRWSKIQLYDTNMPLQVQDVQNQGSVLAYLNDGDLGMQQTYAERTILSDLSTKLCQLIPELVRSLATTDALKDVGLIYLGCHGNDGVALGSNPSDRLTYIDLQMPIKHPDPRPIVFVNACDSARLKQSDGLRRGFLARFASGYIGTLGQVVSIYASKIARCILQSAFVEKDGVQVAELLRQLRAEAVGMIAQKESTKRGIKIPGIISMLECRELTEEEKNLYFLYTFMYVFYGNPLARLRLAKKRAEEG